MAFVVLAACPRQVPPPDYGPEGPVADPGAVLARVCARGERLRSISGEAQSRLWNAKGSVKLTALVAAERPDRLRVDALSFFGQPVASLATNGQRFAYHDLEGGRFTEGVPSARNLARFLGIEVAPADVVALLLGDLPFVPAEASPAMALSLEGYTLTLADPAGETLTATIAPDGARPIAVRIARPGGVLAWEARFEDHEDVGGEQLPRTIRVEDGAGAGVELTWKERTLNAPISADTFSIPRPSGTSPPVRIWSRKTTGSVGTGQPPPTEPGTASQESG